MSYSPLRVAVHKTTSLRHFRKKKSYPPIETPAARKGAEGYRLCTW